MSYEIILVDQQANALAQQANALAQELTQRAPLRGLPALRLAFVAQPGTPPPANDLLLEGTTAIDILVGYPAARRVATGVPWDQLAPSLTRLMRSFLVEHCVRDSFHDYLSQLDDAGIRERLGLPG